MKKASIALLLTAFSSVSSIAVAEQMKPGLWKATEIAHPYGEGQGSTTKFMPSYSRMCVTPEAAANAVRGQPPLSRSVLQSCTLPQDGFMLNRLVHMNCKRKSVASEEIVRDGRRIDSTTRVTYIPYAMNITVKSASSTKYAIDVATAYQAEVRPDEHGVLRPVSGVYTTTLEWLGPDCGTLQPHTN